MKKLILLLTAVGMAVTNVFAARMFPAAGRVVDENGQAVEYATVVLLKGTQQVAGMATDTDGRFSLKVPSGDYTLSIQYLGYDPMKRTVQVRENNDLGDFVMQSSATQIEGVVVKAQLIRHEADRFIMDVANSPAAIGKDGIELLQRAPGVWFDDDKLTINGKGGSKVFVNDRELKMEPEQLAAYLRSLRAEEIQKIEVVPMTGADYDADSSGGVIRITLRKRRENGLDGSLSFRTLHGVTTHEYSPNGNVNIHSGRLDLYASAWGNLLESRIFSRERTRYTAGDAQLASHSTMDGRNDGYGGNVGAVFELAPKHSIGAEFEFWRNDGTLDTDSRTDFTAGGSTLTDSRYETDSRRDHLSATFNYIYRIDTLGSTLKLLADYTRRDMRQDDDNISRIAPPAPAPAADSLYRDNTSSLYRVATATLAIDKRFSPRWTLRAGAKYTCNDMRNDALYEYAQADGWVRNDNQSFEIDYTEHIAAAYGAASASLGRWSFVAGLRAEYTSTSGKGVGQHYLSLFPNANVSYRLTADGAYSLTALYARSIQRPRFWDLNPQRLQASDYTYQTGNPALDPAYRDEVNLKLILKNKYAFTAGMSIDHDEIRQMMRPDAEDPDILCVIPVNFDNTTNFFFTTHLPFQPVRWWELNVGATYLYQAQRMEPHDPAEYQHVVFLNASTTFSLPAKFYIDLSYSYQSRNQSGNCWIEPQQTLNAGVKKRFGDRFTVSFSALNLLDEPRVIEARGKGFTRIVRIREYSIQRRYRIGLTWNFRSGKAFNRKAVEAGSAEEKSRM